MAGTPFRTGRVPPPEKQVTTDIDLFMAHHAQQPITNSLSSHQKAQEAQYVFPYHYLSIYSELHRRILHAHYLSELQLVRGFLQLQPEETILDVGCGDGRLAYELVDPKVKYTGIDYSAQAIAFARAFNPGQEFLVGDVSDLPADRTFDAAAMIQVLEHIPLNQVQECVAGLRRVVAPHGRLIVSVPSTNLPLAQKHYQHFTPDLLRTTFGGRFEVIKIHGHLHAGRAWERLSRMHKFASVLWPIHHKFWLARVYIQHVEKYFTKVRLCDPEKCHTLIALLRRV